jgi:hypothetical protein
MSANKTGVMLLALIAQLFFASPASMSQQLGLTAICSTGKVMGSSDISLSHTTGEAVAVYFMNSSITLSQGFQQPSTTVPTSLTNYTKQQVQINIYPNPANYGIWVRTQGATHPLFLEIYDSLGKIVLIHPTILGSHDYIGLESLSSGLYVIRVYSEVGNTLTTERIILSR